MILQQVLFRKIPYLLTTSRQHSISNELFEHIVSACIYITPVFVYLSAFTFAMYPLSQSMKCFAQNINTGSKLSSSKIQNFTCNYSEYLHKKPF